MKTIRGRRARRGGKVVVGRPDAGLTGVSGLAAVDALAGKLGLAGTLDRSSSVIVVCRRGSCWSRWRRARWPAGIIWCRWTGYGLMPPVSG